MYRIDIGAIVERFVVEAVVNGNLDPPQIGAVVNRVSVQASYRLAEYDLGQLGYVIKCKGANIGYIVLHHGRSDDSSVFIPRCRLRVRIVIHDTLTADYQLTTGIKDPAHLAGVTFVYNTFICDLRRLNHVLQPFLISRLYLRVVGQEDLIGRIDLPGDYNRFVFNSRPECIGACVHIVSKCAAFVGSTNLTFAGQGDRRTCHRLFASGHHHESHTVVLVGTFSITQLIMVQTIVLIKPGEFLFGHFHRQL